jgi:membrane-bound inhibitor of C-type lysozyme
VAVGLTGSAAQAEVQTIATRFLCARGVEIPVVFVNSSDGSAAIMVIEGRQITLLQAPSASGARYAWPSDGSGYVLWTKGDMASFLWHDATTRTDTDIYADCRVAG